MKGLRYILASIVGALLVLVVGGLWLEGARADLSANPGSLIANGSFELGNYAPQNAPDGWQSASFVPGAQFFWSDDVAQQGQKSVRITAATANDARWTQTVSVEPNSTYRFSGWIKTENVVSTASSDQAGANLCIDGTFERTEGLTGSNDWTFVSMLVDSGSSTELTLCARLGFWSDATSGTAWFDNLKFAKIDPDGPKPTWKVLVLIYRLTDFTYTDSGAVEHRVIASMTTSQRQQAAQAAQAFVNTDIPALSSGNSQPQVTVRYPTQTIQDLSPYGADAWWLGPDDVAQDLDPAFDSVIVVWNPEGVDINTNNPEDLSAGKYDSLSPDMGMGQTYTLIKASAALTTSQRNVFKFGYGGSLIAFFDAAGTAPKPAVDNDPGPTDYVNCASGLNYDWVTETLAIPVPNSIFNNDSGFSHDYYSGMTATADQPARCLGITPLAWATGGPVSGPVFYDLEVHATPESQIGVPGTAVTYTLNLVNRGNISDTYQISYMGNSWPTNGPTEAGPLDIDQSWEAPVVVTIPLGVDAMVTDTVTIEVLSVGENQLMKSATLTTEAVSAYAFEAGAQDTALSGDVGTAVTYTVQITNTGNISDSFDVAYSGNAWSATGPNAVGPIARDGTEEFDVVVNIPAGAAGLDTDTLSVAITSQGDANLEENISLITTARTDYQFTATADPAQKSGDVGTAVDYAVEIENKGNITDTYTVAYSGNSWQVSGDGVIGPIAGGEKSTVTVTVNIPLAALGLQTDQVLVTLISQGDSNAQNKVLLTTEANPFYDLELSPIQSSGIGIVGTIKLYPLTLTNTGNVSDSFLISASNTNWMVEFPGEVGPLEPEEDTQIVVWVRIDPKAADGEEESVLITAASQSDGGATAEASITTTAKWPLVYIPALFR